MAILDTGVKIAFLAGAPFSRRRGGPAKSAIDHLDEISLRHFYDGVCCWTARHRQRDGGEQWVTNPPLTGG